MSNKRDEYVQKRKQEAKAKKVQPINVEKKQAYWHQEPTVALPENAEQIIKLWNFSMKLLMVLVGIALVAMFAGQLIQTPFMAQLKVISLALATIWLIVTLFINLYYDKKIEPTKFKMHLWLTILGLVMVGFNFWLVFRK